MTRASRRAQATCNAAMLTYSSMALRASKEQLLAHVEADIVGNILLLYISSSQVPQETVCPSMKIQALPLDFPHVHMFLLQPADLHPVQSVFFSAGPQNLEKNLALVQSITEVGCAIQAVGNFGSFDPVLQHKLLLILQNLMRKTLWDFPASSLHLKVILALEQWSKLKISFSRKEICSLLSDCCQSILPLPSADEQMEEIGNAEVALLQLQSLHMATKALGRLMAVLLKTKPTTVVFVDIVHVLWLRLSSDNPWQRKRALQVYAQLLADCRDGVTFQTRCAYVPFGSLAGLLGPLTYDPVTSSRQLAATCLSSLLHIQGE
ncbi:maestro heat-like repeat-containing protein family member 2B [Anser cygnoides]|uniref:maestro heat-like repeat-containing protein family member 2B n=1 Tax=Anser cygnoides TaxID=8845 RepID=UPI0034D26CEE